jgi:hypothetical protein
MLRYQPMLVTSMLFSAAWRKARSSAATVPSRAFDLSSLVSRLRASISAAASSWVANPRLSILRRLPSGPGGGSKMNSHRRVPSASL